MTWPAAPAPVCPSISTTRVEATLSDRRSSVVISSTVGNAAKSSGRIMLADTIITISDSAMLKVNSRSSMKGGSGSTIMDSTMTTNSGAVRDLAKAAGSATPSFFIRSEIAFMRGQPGRVGGDGGRAGATPG